MRIDRAISNNTNFSRKETSKLIRKGYVKVNQKTINDPAFKIDLNNDVIFIKDEPLTFEQYYYILLNKPKGFVCSNVNKDGRSVFELIYEPNIRNLHIVGRLDKDSTGLVLITNDGDFTHKIKSSKYQIEKEYEVELEKEFSYNMMKELEKDIYLDGKKIKPFNISNVNSNKLNITLIEGKYHHIKRIFSIVKNPVISLKRVRIENLVLNEFNLKEGDYIFIDKEKMNI